MGSTQQQRTSDPRTETVHGSVEQVVYRGDDGLFAVVLVARDGRPGHVAAVGSLGGVEVGETLRLRGRWTRHPVHGERFQVDAFTPVLPSTRDGIARYLGSGLVPGIGKGLAERLVERFGDRALDVIATQSGKLTEVPGIGKQRASAIAAAVRERRDEAELLTYMHSVGLGPALARRIRKRYGTRAVQVLRDDPFLVAEQVSGVGFRTADRIGRASGMALDDPRRAAGAVLHLLGAHADNGHVFATVDQLQQTGEQLDVPATCIETAVESLAGRALLVREEDAVYAAPLYDAELEVAATLARRSAPGAPQPDAQARPPLKAELSDEQVSAVHATFEARLLVVTGGPGTGKTTTVRGIVEAHRAAGNRLLLGAPTGRAAKRLSEASGAEARTIHRILEWNPATASFQRDADNPIEADLVLIDESSMLNLQLAHSLLQAIPEQTTLVLVGDVDQLPPVGPGQVLRHLIESAIARVVRLSQVFRQAQQSHIVRGAHQILDGCPPTPSPPHHRGAGELFVVATSDPDVALRKLREMLPRLSGAYGLQPQRDLQVLSPMRRGPLGTERLNEFLQAEINPSTARTQVPGQPRAGDRVMQLRNDYDKEVYNGDLGEVRRVQGGVTYVHFEGREVKYEGEALKDLTLAYAATVHKVQGSEFPAVVLVLHGSHHVLLNRALTYTAVTRARQLVVVLGDQRALGRAVRNAHSYECQSHLVERLRAEANPEH